MMGLGIGGALSAGGKRLIRTAIFAGVGVAGLGAYGYTQPNIPELAFALNFVKTNKALLIALGVAAIVFGTMLSWWSAHQMQKKMMGGMGMGGMMGGGAGMMMPGMMGGMPSAAPTVKVKCRSCGSHELEEAKFCSKCGTSMG